MQLSRSPQHSIEILESRIAPALLINGANLLGGESPNSGQTSVGDHAVTLVKVLSGRALVWFDNGFITGISVGPNASLEITGNVFGDIVGNLTADGRLSDSDDNPANGEDGGVLLPNNIAGIKTEALSNQKGTIHSIITGGSISNLSISGEIEGVFAGDGVFRAESRELEIGGSVQSTLSGIDFNPVASGVQSIFTFQAVDLIHTQYLAGASVKTANFTNARQLQVIAGSGNPNGLTFVGAAPKGGDITGITIQSAFVPAGAPLDTPSYSLLAGDGANGKSGGAGGSINQLIEKTSVGPVLLLAGQGGDGSGAAGGAGGSITNLDVQSDSSRYTLLAGDGGSGAPGGAGGKLTSLNFANRTPVAGILVAADFNGDGLDDVLVADAGTGQMQLNLKNNTGFAPALQFVDANLQNVTIIEAAGATPVDAAVIDFDFDGDLDVLVAYKNSASLGIFLNNGNGSFYHDLGDGPVLNTVSVALGFAPVKIATNGASGSEIAIAENTDGKGLVHRATIEATSDNDLGFTLSLVAGSNNFKQPIADLVYAATPTAGRTLIVGLNSGAISELVPAPDTSKTPYTLLSNVLPTINGGITDFDIGDHSKRLAILSSTGKTLSIFDVTDTGLTPVNTLDLTPFGGKPLVTHFVQQRDGDNDPTNDAPDQLAVLTALTAGSRVDYFGPAADDGNPATVEVFSAVSTLSSLEAFKNFVPAYGSGGAKNLAAVAGSLSEFFYSTDLTNTQPYALPFATKKVSATAGHGGDGISVGKLIGKGGAGGSILGINADANEIVLLAGDGGNSQTGAAGAAGSINNGLSIVTASGVTVTPVLLADLSIAVTAGNGGTPGAAAKTAAGGAGGSLNGLTITLAQGDLTLTAGLGGDSRGGNAGAGGSANGLTTTARDGSLTIVAGDGGDALSATGAGGAGGSIVHLTHELVLEKEIESLEKPYHVVLTAGLGGDATGGNGGAGGVVGGTSLKLDGAESTYDDNTVTPALVDSHRDSTVKVVVTGGAGGTGAIGGAGGTISNFVSESVFDQLRRNQSIILNFVVMKLTAGDGGTGLVGNGGAGGGVVLQKAISGVTFFDADIDPSDYAEFADGTPLVVTSGTGGNGAVKGGAGGVVSGLTLQNSPFFDGRPITLTHLMAAEVTAGDGGQGGTSDGGAGGSIKGATLGVQSDGAFGGYLLATAGDGGKGGTALTATQGKGGAGGLVTASEFGLVSAGNLDHRGLVVLAGAGGDGRTLGGLGGAVSALKVNTPQSTNGLSASLVAGPGGAVNSASGTGGKGGDVTGITQNKDINSSINLIQAGDGGANPLGKGGVGGSVSAIKTVGFIGRPSNGSAQLGVFDAIDFDNDGNTPDSEVAQGLFSGRGGTGSSLALSGLAGSVANVSARQIAAIAAAVDANGLFGVATKVSQVKADLIGFDVNQNGVFNTTGAAGAHPNVVQPIDGFILAALLQNVTGSKPAFVFNA